MVLCYAVGFGIPLRGPGLSFSCVWPIFPILKWDFNCKPLRSSGGSSHPYFFSVSVFSSEGDGPTIQVNLGNLYPANRGTPWGKFRHTSFSVLLRPPVYLNHQRHPKLILHRSQSLHWIPLDKRWSIPKQIGSLLFQNGEILHESAFNLHASLPPQARDFQLSSYQPASFLFNGSSFMPAQYQEDTLTDPNISAMWRPYPLSLPLLTLFLLSCLSPTAPVSISLISNSSLFSFSLSLSLPLFLSLSIKTL